MQPLKLLNNVQKARLLHSLFLQEIPPFLDYVKHACLIIEDNREELRRDWTNGLLTPDAWIELAAETERCLDRRRKGLFASSVVFAEQLFSGFGSLFMCHQLQQYVGNNHHQDPKFRTAVDLFFNP